MKQAIIKIGGEEYSASFFERMTGEEMTMQVLRELRDIGKMTDEELAEAAKFFDKRGDLKAEYR